MLGLRKEARVTSVFVAFRRTDQATYLSLFPSSGARPNRLVPFRSG